MAIRGSGWSDAGLEMEGDQQLRGDAGRSHGVLVKHPPC